MPSPLEEYSRNYASRLRQYMMGAASMPSALDPERPNPVPSPPIQSPLQAQPQPQPGPRQLGMEGAMEEEDPMEMGSALEGPIPGGPPDEPAEEDQGGGITFAQMVKDTPDEVKEQQLTKLEQALKQGNQTIDSAYDEMVKQLGTEPDPDRKLTRQEKGMLLMQFGLSMLANSRKGLAAAAGEAGASTLQSYNRMKFAPAARYASQRSALEMSRGKAKADLAGKVALEGVKARESANRLPGRFTGDDGFVYFYDEDGRVQQAKDANGQPIRAKENDASGRPNDFDMKRRAFLEVYGVDPRTGEKLTGLARARAEQDAIEFANDRGTTIDDLDLDIIAEESADAEMKADAYRDLTPEQREAKRNEIADARRRRLKRRVRSYVEPNESSRGRPGLGPKRSFNSIEEARAAFQRGEIAVGDRIVVAGVEDVVE